MSFYGFKVGDRVRYTGKHKGCLGAAVTKGEEAVVVAIEQGHRGTRNEYSRYDFVGRKNFQNYAVYDGDMELVDNEASFIPEDWS